MDARLSMNSRYPSNAELVIQRTIELAKQWTPVKTGVLLGSMYRYKNTVGYRAPYAVYVHEIIDNLHRLPTRAKFLEDAAVLAAAEYSYNGRIGIEYEPLAVHIGSNLGNTLYDGRY